MKKITLTTFIATLFLILVLPASAHAMNARATAELGAHITGGKITSINGTTLSVTNNNKSFTVNTDSSTKIIRRYGGIGTLSQVSVGDHINIAGSWTDSGKTVISATVIRDGSIQELHGTFQGSVTSTTSNGFVISTTSRGSLTIIVTSDTKLAAKGGSTITLSQIVAGNTVIVDGLWNHVSSTVTAQKVRDQSL